MTKAHWLSTRLIIRPFQRFTNAINTVRKKELEAPKGLTSEDGEINNLTAGLHRIATRSQVQHRHVSYIERAHSIRSAANRAMLGGTNQKALLIEISRILRELGGYQFVWIGLVTDDGNVVPEVSSGLDIEVVHRMLRDSAEVGVTELVISAIECGGVQLLQDRDIGSMENVWQRFITTYSFFSGIGLPILFEGHAIAGVGIYSCELNIFDEEEIQLLTQVVSDLAFGLASLLQYNELRRNQEFLKLVIDNIPSMLFVKDAQNLRFVSMNAAGERFIGYCEAELIGKSDYELFPADQAEYFVSQDRLALSGEQKIWISEELVTTKSGDVITLQTKKLRLLDADGAPKYLLGISEDITERVKAERRMKYLADYDSLTGLANRRLLMERLQQAWNAAQISSAKIVVMFIDLDGFKEINDTLGHSVGDETLRVISTLLRDCFPERSMLARVGGDEFVAVLEHILRLDDITLIAERVREKFHSPLSIDGHEIFLSASVGISCFPGDADTFDALLRHADIAMYHAKEKGRNTHAYYTPDMKVSAAEKMEMRNLLRHAIERDELKIHYQPKVCIHTNQIIGAEALLRWESKELGMVSPARFIPLAEESGLIVPIGDWVLRTSCIQAREWQKLIDQIQENQSSYDEGRMPLKLFVIAINISAKQFRGNGLVDKIAATLLDAGLDEKQLELEVTESIFMDQDSNVTGMLKQISETGVRLAIDDFGTGYSSLSYLKQLPVNVLKIDQSFIRGLTDGSGDAAIVTAIVAMAKSLNLTLTAEGVETIEQLTELRLLACHEYQGFLFSRALPPGEFTKLLINSCGRTCP